jgi:hypothetical protein
MEAPVTLPAQRDEVILGVSAAVNTRHQMMVIEIVAAVTAGDAQVQAHEFSNEKRPRKPGREMNLFGRRHAGAERIKPGSTAPRPPSLLYAGNNLDKAREIFAKAIKHRPRIRLTIPQQTRVLRGSNSCERSSGLPLILVTTSPAWILVRSAGLPASGCSKIAPWGTAIPRLIATACVMGLTRAPIHPHRASAVAS